MKAFLHKPQYKCHAKLDCGSSLLAIYSQLAEMCLYTSLQKQGGPAESLKACQGLGYGQVCRDLTTGVIYPCSLQYLQLLKPASTQNRSFTLSCNLLHFLSCILFILSHTRGHFNQPSPVTERETNQANVPLAKATSEWHMRLAGVAGSLSHWTRIMRLSRCQASVALL